MVLIKFVLASLLTYYPSLFAIPSFVENRIEKFQREFLWGKGKEENGMQLVAWDDVCKPKNLGGLGIGRIRDINKALLSKWL